MGQRSQMYLISKHKNNFYLVANYYQWNYAERMISRTKSLLERVVDWAIANDYYFGFTSEWEVRKLRRLMDVNFDMRDVQISCDIVKEFDDYYDDYYKDDGVSYAQSFFDYCFAGQDNNDGQMYMYIDLDVPQEKRNIELCFLKSTFTSDCDIFDGETYLNKYASFDNKSNWKEYFKESDYHDDETIAYTESNLRFISDNSILLSKDKLNRILREVSEKQQKEEKDKNGTHN